MSLLWVKMCFNPWIIFWFCHNQICRCPDIQPWIREFISLDKVLLFHCWSYQKLFVNQIKMKCKLAVPSSISIDLDYFKLYCQCWIRPLVSCQWTKSHNAQSFYFYFCHPLLFAWYTLTKLIKNKIINDKLL